MRRKFFILRVLVFMLLLNVGIFAQTKIQGVVTDEAGNPIQGAVVMLQKTTVGAVANAKGEFSLEVPKNFKGEKIIETKFMGFRTNRLMIDEKNTTILSIVLTQDMLMLDQVVVTGTAEAVEKKSLGNSINTLSEKEIKSLGTVQLDAALSGKVPGAMVQLNSGNPGGGTSVRLRGISTLYSGTSDPLYIVDGIIIDNSATSLIDLGGNSSNRLADIDPDDIERVEVVKGAAAAALYGSRANNGVVQIFTKRGKSGDLRVRLNSSIGYDEIVKTLDMIKYPYYKATKDAALTPVTRYDYQDEVFRKAPRYSTNLSLSGGDAITKFFVSGSVNSQAGIIKSAQYDRQSLRFNLDRIMNSWLNVSLSTNYVHSLNNTVANGGVDVNGFGVLTGLTQSPNYYNFFADADGIYPKSPIGGRANFLEVIDKWKAPEEIDRFIGGLKFDMTPLSGLSIQYRLGYDYYTQSAKYYIPRTSLISAYTNGFSQSVEKISRIVNSNIDVAYNYNVVEDLLKATSAAGTEYSESRYTLVNSSAQDLVPQTELLNGSSSLDAVSEARDVRKTLGYYYQQTFNLLNQLYLTGSLRADAASTFGANERWQMFPKFSASYIVSENKLWKENVDPILGNAVNLFKIRGALGYSGGQPVSSFGRLSTYQQISYVNMAGLVNSTLKGNDDLKPERMREYEIGTDLELFDRRIGIEFTYFNKKVEDLIIQQVINPSTGYDKQLQNVGILSNKGIEVMVKTLNFNNENFVWSTTATLSTNNPIIDKLYGSKVITANSWSQTILEEGKAPSTFYTNVLFKDSVDANGLPVKNPVKKYLGDPNPKLMWSLTNEFTVYKDITIRVMFDAQMDFKILDWNERSLRTAAYPNHPDYEKEYTGQLPWGYNARVASAIGEFVHDASFVKCREVSIVYNWKDEYLKSVGISSVQFNLTGRNLFTITNYKGYDPEVNAAGQDVILRGWDFAVTPIPRSIVFGITANL